MGAFYFPMHILFKNIAQNPNFWPKNMHSITILTRCALNSSSVVYQSGYGIYRLHSTVWKKINIVSAKLSKSNIVLTGPAGAILVIWEQLSMQ